MLAEKDLQSIATLISNSVSVLLDEMERYDKKYEKRFSDISKEIDDLKEIFTIAAASHP